MDHKLLSFLKALADPMRLTIVGLLAQEPRSVDELAAMVHLSPPTVSHHLARLHKAGLVAAKAEQYYNIYALNDAALQQHVALLTPEALAQWVQANTQVDEDAYRQQVLARWLKEDRLQGLPAAVQQRRLVLQWLSEKFAPDQRYGAQQVEDVLRHWCSHHDPHRLDETTVGRALLEAQLLARTRDGRWYWRVDSPLTQVENFAPDLLPPANTSTLHIPFQLSPLLALVRIAIRFKAGRAYKATEVDALIRQWGQEIASDLTAVRSRLVSEQLLAVQVDGTYLRPTLTPDHPVQVKLRAEAASRDKNS